MRLLLLKPLWFALFLPALLQDATADGTPEKFGYYDVPWARGLTLEHMRFSETARTNLDTVVAIGGSIAAFDQPYVGENGEVKTLRWRQRGILFLPPPGSQPVQGLLYNCHDTNPAQVVLHREWGEGIARAFGIPVLIHGWEPDVVSAVAGRGFHTTQELMMKRLLQARLEQERDLPRDGRYFFNGSPLAKADLVALTWIQRWVEKERGWKIKDLGSLGISKEGGAHWILAALDDRLKVCAPGGSYHEDLSELLHRYAADWNGQFPAHLGNEELFNRLFRFADWTAKTAAGRCVDAVMNPVHFRDRLKSKHFLVSGDLGQHDGPFPVLAENKFLKAWKHPSWIYVRVHDGSGVILNDKAGELGRSLLPHVADVLVHGTRTPATPVVSVEREGRRVRFNARATMAPGARQEAELLYMISPERSLRRADAHWTVAQMKWQRDGQFELDWLPEVPPDHGLTYMVVVKELAVRDPIRFWRSASSLPDEVFPLPEHKPRMPSWKE